MRDKVTSIFWLGHKVHDQAETDEVPSLGVLVHVHGQKVLLDNGWMSASKVDRCRRYPRRTRRVVIWFQRTNFQQAKGYANRKETRRVEDGLRTSETPCRLSWTCPSQRAT